MTNVKLGYTYIGCLVLLRDVASYYRTRNSDTRLRRPQLSHEPGCFIPQRRM